MIFVAARQFWIMNFFGKVSLFVIIFMFEENKLRICYLVYCLILIMTMLEKLDIFVIIDALKHIFSSLGLLDKKIGDDLLDLLEKYLYYFSILG